MGNPSLPAFLPPLYQKILENANPAGTGFRHFDGGKKWPGKRKCGQNGWTVGQNTAGSGQKRIFILFSGRFIHNTPESFRFCAGYPPGTLVWAE